MQRLFSDSSLHVNSGAQDEALYFDLNHTFFGWLLADPLTQCAHFPYASSKPATLSSAALALWAEKKQKNGGVYPPCEAEKNYQLSVLNQLLSDLANATPSHFITLFT